MSDNERELLNDLRAVAEADQSEAPPEIRDRLLAEFRSRSVWQRRKRWLPAAGIAGIASIAAAVLLFVSVPNHSTDTLNPVAQSAAEDVDTDFYPLPEADGLPPVETATVVRVQMPLASLQLMGVAVNDAGSGDSVQADILLGQDGLARGVRLVQ